MTHEELVDRVSLAFMDHAYTVHAKGYARAAIAEVLAVLNEPTYEMQDKGDCYLPQFREPADSFEVCADVFKAMLAASPLASAEDKHSG